MAHCKAAKITLFVFLAVLCNTATAQTGCAKTLIGLSPCLNYVTGNSSTPSSTCCSQLSSVVSLQPQCLCLLLNGTATSYGYNVNQTLALALPSICNVQTPPVSKCNAGNGASPSKDTPQSPLQLIPPKNQRPIFHQLQRLSWPRRMLLLLVKATSEADDQFSCFCCGICSVCGGF